MKWNRFTLKTKTEAEDIVICTLAEVGIEGVEIQDKQPLTDEDKAQMFVDIMPEGNLWEICLQTRTLLHDGSWEQRGS